MEKWRWHFVHQGHTGQPALSILNGTVQTFYSFSDINIREAHHGTASLLPLKVCFDRERREDALHLKQRGHRGTRGTSITSDLSRIRGRGRNSGGFCWADPMTAFKGLHGSADPALTTRGPYCQDSHPRNLLVLTSIQQKALLQSKNISWFVKWLLSFLFKEVNHLCSDWKHQKIYIAVWLCVCALDETIVDQFKSG